MSDRAIEVVNVAGFALVQDAGRPGRMHEGIPPGGALVPELLASANRAAGNADGEAAIELVGALTIAARGGTIVVASEDGEPEQLEDGASRTFLARRDRRARYLAFAGGIDVPVVLGGKGTLRVAGIGGFEGRGLRKGDRLLLGAKTGEARRLPTASSLDAAPIRAVLGPDDGRFVSEALAAFFDAAFTISPASDRTGTRLAGPPLACSPGASPLPSMPMVAGAIEVPPSGQPIVLGPDHPTTGGYPVIAVIVRADLGRFHARPLGADVRFSRAHPARATRV